MNTTLSTPRDVPRRTLAAGVAWTAPAIVLASAAPAFGTSQNDEGCFVMNWADQPIGTKLVEGQVFTTTPLFDHSGTPPTITVTTSGTVAESDPKPGEDISGAGYVSKSFNRTIGHKGTQVGYYPDEPYDPIPGTSPSDPGLVLNIGSRGSYTTVRFAFSQPVKSVTVPIANLTRSANDANRYKAYTDQVSLNHRTTATGNTLHLNATELTPNQGYHRTQPYESEDIGRGEAARTYFTASPYIGGITVLNVRYQQGPSGSQDRMEGWQFIAIMNLKICI